MASPFTQTLSMRNFLALKRIPTPEDNAAVGGGRRNSANGSGGRRNSGNSGGRRNSGNNTTIKPKRSSGGSTSAEFQAIEPQATYEDLLKKSRRNIKMAANNSKDELGSYSCHEIGRNKPKVHFGDDAVHHLHNSCPIIDEETQRQLDVTFAAKRGLSLSALPTVAEKPQTILLRKENIKEKDSNLVVESIRGDRLATIDGEGESIVLQNPESTPADRRLVQDTDGNIYAVLLRTLNGDSKNLYRICGVEKGYEDQRKSRESGLYTYAEVKNSGGIGVQFSMKVRGETKEKYVTKFFGPSIFKWGQGRPRGFLIKNQQGKECARITLLGGAKAISVEPNMDVRLMTCFAAIIDEMVEKRMR